MKKPCNLLFAILFCIGFKFSFAQPTAPNGKKWEKIEVMSDEFNGSSLNNNKWLVNDPQWEGRRPARFETSSVSVSNGNLKISASKKSNPFSGWTHSGGLVRSKTRNQYGYYETRMKGNKTFMSSTFWLINKRNEFTGCDFRTTELDITETVGVNSNGASWVNNMVRNMNANTHSRGTSCNSTPVGIKGGKAALGDQSWQSYHTYGVWWKGPKELLFYLDGKFVFQVTPVANFNLPMYLRMVVETYDWNPPKAGGDGMNDSQANRTTYYDWVRSYKLVNCNSNCGDNPDPDVVSIDCNSLPSSILTSTSIQVPVKYSADQNRDVVVELWNAGWLGQGRKTVGAGSGTTTVTIDLTNAPTVGSNYTFKASVRPVGAGWQQNIKSCSKNNITLSTSNPTTVSIDCNSLPSSADTGTSIQVPVKYSADQNRDVVVELWNSGWLGQGRKTVGAGSGTTTVTIDLTNAPPAGSNYTFKASVRPVGAGWQQNIEACSKNNITLSVRNQNTVSINCNSLPSSVNTGTSIQVPVSYSADQNRDVVVELWNSGWLGQGRKTVGAGSGTTTVTINLNNAPAVGSNYTFKASVRPVGAGWQQNIKSCSKNNITLSSSGSGGGGAACNTTNTITGLQTTGSSNNTVTVAFNQLSGVNTYELRAFNKGTFNGNINGAVSYKSGSSSPLTIGGLSSGTEYTFVMRAICNSGGPTPTSQVNGSTSGSGGGGDVGPPDNGGDTGCTGQDTFDQGVRIVPNANSWKDSYKANGYCFCKSSFDHGVGNFKITINGQGRNIRDICDELKKHPRFRDLRNGDPRYNTIQCGNEPGHGDAITIQGKRIKDEKVCPGRVDQGSKGCKCKGPKFDMKWLSSRKRFGGSGKEAPEEILGADSFDIYPNPVNASGASFLSIYSTKDELARISIHDLSGRLITSMNHTAVKNTSYDIEITSLIDTVSSVSGAFIISYKTRSISKSKVIIVK